MMDSENAFKVAFDAMSKECEGVGNLKEIVNDIKPLFKTMFELGVDCGVEQSKVPSGYAIYSINEIKKQCGCGGMAQDGWGRDIVCSTCANKGYYYDRELLK